MPENLDICLVDVNSGSDTRVLVRQVLNWDKENRSEEKPDQQFSGYLFSKLNENFKEIKELLQSDLIDVIPPQDTNFLPP